MQEIPGTYCKGYIALSNQRFLPIDIVTRGVDEAEAQVSLEKALDMLEALVKTTGRDFQR